MEKLLLYIPKAKHSDVIGKGGSTIKELQAFGVTVDVPKRESPSDVVTVTGSRDAVQKAKARIDKELGFAASTVPVSKATFAVEDRNVGKLVGSGGSTLKEIQSTCEVSFELPRGSGVGILCGSPSAISNAQKKIEGILKQTITLQIEGGSGGGGGGGGSGSSAIAGERPQIDLDAVASQPQDLTKVQEEVLFFPDPSDRSFKVFLSYLEGAKRTIDVCVFTISDDRIANFLIVASKTLKVRIISDLGTSANKGSDIERMTKAGIEIRVNSSGLMHNKYAILDGRVLLNGSFNWTSTAATQNSENVVVTPSTALVSAFSSHFASLWSSYTPFRPGMVPQTSREIEFN